MCYTGGARIMKLITTVIKIIKGLMLIGEIEGMETREIR
jgi:hypothetical protein